MRSHRKNLYKHVLQSIKIVFINYVDLTVQNSIKCHILEHYICLTIFYTCHCLLLSKLHTVKSQKLNGDFTKVHVEFMLLSLFIFRDITTRTRMVKWQ